MPSMTSDDLTGDQKELTQKEMEDVASEMEAYVKEYSIAEWEDRIKEYERWKNINMMDVQDPETGLITPESLYSKKVISEDEYQRMRKMREEIDLYYENLDFSPKGAKRRRLANRARRIQQKQQAKPQ